MEWGNLRKQTETIHLLIASFASTQVVVWNEWIEAGARRQLLRWTDRGRPGKKSNQRDLEMGWHHG